MEKLKTEDLEKTLVINQVVLTRLQEESEHLKTIQLVESEKDSDVEKRISEIEELFAKVMDID